MLFTQCNCMSDLFIAQNPFYVCSTNLTVYSYTVWPDEICVM